MDAKIREKAITRTSILGIGANVFLASFKAGAGLIAGSIAIVLDAVNNLTDAMSSIITIAGIKLAKKKPDEKHPYGYGRIEYFSTILISLLILFAGGTSLIESVKKILAPEVPDYSVVTIVVIVASVIIKLLLGRYVKSQGEKYNSDALVASGADASFDAIISVSTLVGAIITLIFKISVDGILGAIISCFILKAGAEMFMEAVGHVLGNRPDSEVTKAIKASVREVPGVLGAYDLVVHNYGPDHAIGSVHVEVEDDITAAEFHDITVHIQRKIEQEFKVFLTVGIYAIDIKDKVKVEMRERIIEFCTSHEGVINAHGIYIDQESKYISFDIMCDFSISDKKAFLDKIIKGITDMYEGYTVAPSMDTNYSD